MQIQNRKHRPTQAESLPVKRQGFSLVELMIVLIIIAILLGLLFPAIGSAVRSARVATVRAEISSLEKAIQEFKLKYGVEPPSRFALCEDSADWTGTARGRESLAFIRRAWPNFDWQDNGDPTSGSVPSVSNPIANNEQRDFNGDGDESDIIILQGAECLLFFLGGEAVIVDSTSTSPVANGFSTNPAMPFVPGGTRVGPFHEFDQGRMLDTDGDLNYEYIDTLPGQQLPYQYFSSNEGRGYAAQGPDGAWGVAGTDDDSDGTDDNITEAGWSGSDDEVILNGCAPYTNGPVAWKPNSFQILSPGPDFEYGVGGNFDGDKIVTSAIPERAAERVARGRLRGRFRGAGWGGLRGAGEAFLSPRKRC